MIQFGYACLAQGVANTQMKACTIRTATTERLHDVTAHNLAALLRLVQYNQKNNIPLLRISSDLIPFGSSPVNTLCWQEVFAEQFVHIGSAIAAAKLRVSMHPGQYTVLNSPNEDVVTRALADLDYHEQVLRLLHTDSASKLILHVGGAYGDKSAAMERFCRNWECVSDSVRQRIVLENDERIYTIAEVLSVAKRLGIPAVLDTLHHTINPPAEQRPLADWIAQCAATWKSADGRQKIHYSQQSAGAKLGAHSQTIYTEPFLQFYDTICDMDLDIMLEVKDKNLSAVKCGILTAVHPHISLLEREWANYKYNVLEHSHPAYLEIRSLLKDKTAFPARQFYSILEQAMDAPIEPNGAVNALLHVWGYFKTEAQPSEKKRFFTALENYKAGAATLASVKKQLLRLAKKYDERYLLQSYYFIK